MENKTTPSNYVKVLLDPDNDIIETKSGFKIFIDTSFEPEKHATITGTVTAVPKNLIFHVDGNAMPWKTKMELQVGDRVVMYYLAVMNCLASERRFFIRENKRFNIFIAYNNIYAIIRGNNVFPINGFVLVEPQEDPEWIDMQERAKKLNLIIPDLRKPSKTNVTFGKVVYMGEPNERYFDDYKSDKNVNIKVGDVVILKKVRDIPLENEYHAKAAGGRKLYRLQRHDILAVI